MPCYTATVRQTHRKETLINTHDKRYEALRDDAHKHDRHAVSRLSMKKENDFSYRTCVSQHVLLEGNLVVWTCMDRRCQEGDEENNG